MCIKKYITVLALLLPVLATAQSLFDDYSLDRLTTTAQYGEGERQSNAQNALAIRYNTGTKGAPLNPSKAVYWFKVSASNGNKYAMYNLAYAYLNGRGTDEDVSKAVYWMEESAKRYLPAAAATIGNWYFFGTYVTQNPNKAAKYLKDGAFGGNAEAMYLLGTCFAYGYGVSADFHKANFWAHRAIDNKNYSGYHLLGNMYQFGKTVDVNSNIARHYYEMGIEKNNWSCMVDLGDAFLTDFFGEKNIERAAEYYTMAANQGSTSAMAKIADLNYYKVYGIDDISTAAFWYQKLFDMGNGDNYANRLIYIYNTLKKYSDALRIYNKKAEAGDTDAMNQIAYYYAQGKGVNQDYEKAITTIDKAISLAPDKPNYLDSKGEILLMKGDVKGATKIWKKINTTFPLFYQQHSKENNGKKTNLDEYMSTHAR